MQHLSKPFSQACENNQEPIRLALDHYFQMGGHLLEIGSGTGQHAFYISNFYPKLIWQTSDVRANLSGIETWVREGNRDNLKSPIDFDINSAEWNKDKVDYIYSANTVHIMSWNEVVKLFALLPKCLVPSGYFFLYGPFNYNGKFTSESNQRFDLWLKEQAPHRGIRDFEALNKLAEDQGFMHVNDLEMPANNRLLIWKLVN